MKPKIDLTLIDANNLGFRVYHTIDKDNKTEEIELDFLFAFLNSVQLIANMFKCSNIVFAWDHKKSFRKRKNPEYKNRKRQELVIDLYKQFNILKKEILPGIGFKNIFQQAGIEADDIIAQICDQESKTNKIIISNDRDMRQCLDYFTWIHTGKKLITKDEFTKEIFRLNPKYYYPKIKALAGCTSDNVAGVVGVGELTAAKYFSDKRKLSKKKIDLIENGMWIMHRNLPFVQLPYSKTKSFKLTYNDFSKDRMVGVFEKYEFEYFLKNMNKWEIFYA
jgi:DNA polymerase-1